MKTALSISFSLLIVAAGNTFASPQEAVAPDRHPAVQDAQQHSGTSAPTAAVGLGQKGDARSSIDSRAPIYVAEVRKEFGSQYQRY